MKYPRFTGAEPCTEVDASMWFTGDDSKTYQHVDKLRAICGGCEMLQECQEYALHVRVSGFWGGLSEAERGRIRKQRGIFAVPVVLGA